jgi:hypothetical protein
MPRSLVRLICALIPVSLAGAASAVSGEPPAQEYVHRTATKTAVVNSAASATIGELRNRPREWGRGATGFAKRFASSFATHAVKSGIHLTVSRIRHEKLDYHRSNQAGFAPRLKYALLSTVVTRKTTTGRKTVATGQIAGNVGAGFISRLWQPARLHTVGGGVATSGILLGADAGTNVVREFWPEIRHPRRARQQRDAHLEKRSPKTIR